MNIEIDLAPASGRFSFKWLAVIPVFLISLLVFMMLFMSLFGFRFTMIQGSSMEPAIHDGDLIWMKQTNIAGLKAGEIVTLGSGTETITHRLETVVRSPDNGYVLQTRGDANQNSELWVAAKGEKVGVAFLRIPAAGYLMDFLRNGAGKIMMLVFITSLLFLWIKLVRNRNNEQIVQQI